MNVKKLIKKFEERKTIIGNFQGYAVWWEDVKEIFEQLDEPQKVVVPQFVADWYEKHKDDFEFNVWDYVFMFNEKEKSDFKEWFNDIGTKSFQTLVNMHQFGYEVEKEKRYLVKMKNILDRESFLNLSNTTKIWFFGDKKDTEYVYVHHTRKELEEAGFGWVFDCSGVQIEEVKDE